MSTCDREDQRIDKIEVSLIQSDAATRRERAIRIVELSDALSPVSNVALGLVGGGPETGYLRVEAMATYRAGFGAATVVLSHAACERELSGWIQSFGADAPKGWTRWGLGKLVSYALEQGFLATDVAGPLLELNERRRFLYHLQDGDLPEMTYRRASEGLSHKDQWVGGMTALLLRDGLDAIKATLRLLEFLAKTERLI